MMTAKNINHGYNLNELLQGLPLYDKLPDIQVTGISVDSREVSGGELFMVFDDGTTSNQDYLQSAIESGAAVILIDKNISARIDISPVPVIHCKNLYQWIGIIANRFYHNSSLGMNVFGVTGTNGKTSVSYLLAHAANVMQPGSSGLIGTLGYGIVGNLTTGPNTTPDAITVHRLLADYHSEKIKTVAMEVSSHGLHQYRVEGVSFETAIYTNLTRDHLDYHQTEEAYAEAKRRLFTDFNLKNAVINLDDNFGRKLLGVIPDNVNTFVYTLAKNHNSVFENNSYLVYGEIKNIKIGEMILSIHSPWGNGELTTGIFGYFNASNILAVFTALCASGFEFDKVLYSLSQCSNIPGRMESYTGVNHPTVVIDYAHTPDALQQVLNTLRPLSGSKLICVFGCGGDRDKGKREIMGRIASEIADQVVLTNDNPRTESPQEIINQIMKGIRIPDKVIIEPARDKAISQAIDSGSQQDVVLIAGKGHETYQDISGKKIPYSDRAVVMKCLEANT